MPLRPPEFEADPASPFEHDKLGLQDRVKTLCRVLTDEPGPALVSISGGFGTGKTAFLKMCAAHLRSQEVAVVEYNAWQQSHTSDPLIDLVSSVGRCHTETATRLKKLAANMAWRVASVATRGIVEREDYVVSADNSNFGAWEQAEDNVAEFKQTLSDLAAESDGRLVVLIDELDRCLPAYAMDLLNTARHLFDVPGVIIVLGVNSVELCNRVKQVYGPACNADEYLRRFVDLPIELGDPSDVHFSGFLRTTIESAGLEHDPNNALVAGLKLLAARSGASLRDVQQTVRHVARILPAGEAQLTDAAYMTIVAMMVLRFVDRAAYLGFVSGAHDAFKAVVRLREGVAAIPDTEFDDEWTMNHIEAALLSLQGQNGVSIMAAPDDFNPRYLKAGLGDQAAAEAALSIVVNFVQGSRRRFARGGLADMLELVT